MFSIYRNSLWIPALPCKWGFLLHAAESCRITCSSMKEHLVAVSQTPRGSTPKSGLLLACPCFPSTFLNHSRASAPRSVRSQKFVLEIGQWGIPVRMWDCGHPLGGVCPFLGLGSMGFSVSQARPPPEALSSVVDGILKGPKSFPPLKCEWDGRGAAGMGGVMSESGRVQSPPWLQDIRACSGKQERDSSAGFAEFGG